MSTILRLSSEHTIALPEEVIKKMHFTANDEILVQVEEDKLVLSKKTGNYMGRLRGLHKGVWKNGDSEKFLKKERQSWIRMSKFPNLKIIDVDLAVADIASTLRAKYSIKTPDAIQVATAIFALKKIEEIEVVAVKDFVSCY